ncbi:MAG TPA: sodium:proton antiporter NhaD [Chryseosolibacter sp.]|nr:sodium:proton antiporter NhaD [Chryseosolibacter sp.]
MELVIIAVFAVGYLAIAFEHRININKTASALLTGVICWTLFILSDPSDWVLSSAAFQEHIVHASADVAGNSERFRDFVSTELSHHLGTISEILFFLLGAMTIVELIDSHHGFRIITDRVRTKNPVTLMWIVCWMTFFLSSILDNLTTTIVMVSLIRKLIPNHQMRLFFAGMIVIAANAGGAWTPIGDVTTTMLWIGGQITTVSIMKSLFIPSVICILAPLLFLTFTMKGKFGANVATSATRAGELVSTGKAMLVLGVLALISVPIFKTLTHLPPYMGMLAGLGALWVFSESIQPHVDDAKKKHYSVAGALSRVDVPSVLFFLGILLAVGALESMQALNHFAMFLNDTIGDNRVIITLIGLLSAVVDNVPLVAASMGMYSLDVYPTDHMIWEYLAYCAGTGGSILIIGSAAGVAAMGMEKIDFLWYLKRMSVIALLGYLAGAGTYLLLQSI